MGKARDLLGAVEPAALGILILFLSNSFAYAQTSDGEVYYVDKVKIETKKTDCSSGSILNIDIDGEIGSDTAFLVDTILSKPREMEPCIVKDGGKRNSIWVFLTSGGGWVKYGIQLGEVFRKHDVVTVAHGECSSSCAIAFLGGTVRLLEGELTFHAPYLKTESGLECVNDHNLNDFFIAMLGREHGQRMIERNHLYCSEMDGWKISHKDTAKLYGLHTPPSDWESN